MRRDRIVKAVNILKDALHAAQIRDLLRITRNGQQADGVNRTQRILTAYNVFTQHYQGFSQDEKHLMTFFGLDPLLDVNFWSSLIDGEQAVSRKLLSEVDVGAYNVVFVMPKLRELLTRENDRDNLFITDGSGGEYEMKRVKVLIAEKERALTNPSTMINIIRSMGELYDALSALHGADGVALAIGSIDSGGAKSLDFFGGVRVMEALDTLFVNVWNRVKHSHEENIRYQVEMALMAVGFVGKVKECQTGGLITEDQGQRITRMAAKAFETLLRSGAYTENMETVREVRASQYLTPKTQLLEFKEEPRVEQKRDESRDMNDVIGGALAALGGGAGLALGGGGGLAGLGAGYGAPMGGAPAIGGPAEPLQRAQEAVLREFRDHRDSVRELKDLFEGSPTG